MKYYWLLLYLSCFLSAGPFEGGAVFSTPPQGSSEKSLVSSYQELRKFVQDEKIGRIIYLVRYNEAPRFFHPEATEEESFIRLLFSSPLPPSCKIELMFDGSPCSYRSRDKWKAPDQYLRTNFPCADLKHKLDYFADLYQKARGMITGVVLDPREMALLNDIQKGINYIDAYLHLNSISHYVRKGILLPLDAVMLTFLSRSTLPVQKMSPLGLWVQKKSLEAFPLGEKPLWRKNDPRPLLDEVYVDVCSSHTPYLFEAIAENPAQGARCFLSLLTLTPYKKGEGRIKFSYGGKEIQGKDTAFMSEIIPGTPIGIHLSGQEVQLGAAEGKPQSNEGFKLMQSARLSSNEYVPYYVVEAQVNYRLIPITYEMAQGITWVFNLKPHYFGRYSRKTLAQFIDALKDQGKDFGLFKGTSQSTLPLFPHFAFLM